MTLTGTSRLVGFIVRRDRVRLTVWILGLIVLLVGSAASLLAVYPDQASIDSYARLFGDNPALTAFAGPGYGFDNPSLGVILVNETQLWGAIGVALMSIFLVTRNTRAEEDSERADLIRSGVVGRHAPTAAALVVAAAANLVIGAVTTIGFIALDYPTVGSLALVASIISVGVVFVGVTAVAAQLTGSSRACLAMGSLVLLVSFVVRAIGDISGTAMTWLSPIGWAQAIRAFAGERWWTVALSLMVALALVIGALWLSILRDLGSGLLGVRPGPATSHQLRRHPLALPVRLQRGALIGWLAGLFATGVVYGSFADSVDAMVADNPQIAEVFTQAGGANLTDSYFSTAVMMLALIAGGLAISSAMAPNTEERAGRADMVLAGPVTRHGWFASYLITAVVQTILAVTAAGMGVGVAYAVVMGEPWQVVRLTGVALVMLPAVMVLLGITAALYGLVPRATPAAWVPLAVAAVVGFFGELLRLPPWARGLSPFHYLPMVPAQGFTATAPVLLTAVAVTLMVAGFWGLRQRDIAVS